ncbi:MAG: alanine racemase [Clostridia bacterium]|nr:alanine racemase [Clostridia bacterium]
MSRPELVLSAAALRENWRIVRDKAGDAAVWCMLKGDAYGMGLVAAAGILAAAGADRFAVTEAEEVTALRAAGIAGRILLVRNTLLAEEYAEAFRGGAEVSIGSAEALSLASETAQNLSLRAGIHIEFDLGMGRGGFSPEDVENLAEKLQKYENITVCGTFGHPSRAFEKEKYTRLAAERLSRAVERLRAAGIAPGEVHFADSVALFRFPFARFDAVRVGSALTGGLLSGSRAGLRRVGRAECAVAALHTLRPGDCAGYGASFRARREMMVAVLPMGYADGAFVSRARDMRRAKDALHGILSVLRDRLRKKELYVTLRDKPCRVVGYVGMKHLLFDVTGLACAPGDTVRVPVDLLLAGKMLPIRWEEE